MSNINQSVSSPTPSEIIQLAARVGYHQRRPEVSATLFFQKEEEDASNPILVNVYYTTRSVMTMVDHPKKGYADNQLWRSNTYQTLEELELLLKNPRLHTGKGYRNKNQACRGCIRCGDFKNRTEFSDNQWRKGPDANKCKDCVGFKNEDDDDVGSLSSALQDIDINAKTNNIGGTQEDEDYVNVNKDFPSLTAEALEQHDQKTTAGGGDNGKKERRQFNCPDCPRHGRGKHVFFKKVPVYKPIVKCPKCKMVTHGKCQRLAPIPKHQEKGYGLFKCHKCQSKWGSSRAIANIGQECYTCKDNKEQVFVKPFRLEVVKFKEANQWGGILGGGPRRSSKRVPRNPVDEDEEMDPEYTEQDQRRHASAASNALVGGRGEDYDATYDYVKREDDENSSVSSKSTTATNPTLPPGGGQQHSHHCQGCATGICKSRFLPKSKPHDNSDGDTVSTSMSVLTNSSMAKDDYLDRDLGFFDYHDKCDVDEEEQ